MTCWLCVTTTKRVLARLSSEQPSGTVSTMATTASGNQQTLNAHLDQPRLHSRACRQGKLARRFGRQRVPRAVEIKPDRLRVDVDFCQRRALAHPHQPRFGEPSRVDSAARVDGKARRSRRREQRFAEIIPALLADFVKVTSISLRAASARDRNADRREFFSTHLPSGRCRGRTRG